MEKTEEVKVIKIVPERDKLSAEVRKNIPCPIDGCGKVLAQSAALRLHLVLTHKIVQNEEDKRFITKKVDKEATGNTRVQYHCPENSCHFNEQSTRHFTTLKMLREHYMKIHAPKTHKCSKCEMSYALDRERRRHEADCGIDITCDICQVQFKYKTSLLTHCKQFKHRIPIRFKKPSTVLVPAQTVGAHSQTRTREDLDSNHKLPVPSILPKPSMILVPIPSLVRSGPASGGQPMTCIMVADCRPLPLAQPKVRSLPPLKQKKLSPQKNQVRFADSQNNTDPIEMVRRDADTQTDILTYLMSGKASKVKFTPPSSSCKQDSASTSTQTSSERLKRTAAQTQTSGDLILQKAMQSANIPIRKESRGSQVSPRVRRKRPSLCEITTQTSPRKRVRKTKKTTKMTQDAAILGPSENIANNPSFTNEWGKTVGSGVQNSPCFPVNDSSHTLWNDLCDNETQTIALLQELDESLAESIATQTFDHGIEDKFSKQTIGEHIGASTSTQTLESFLSENIAPGQQEGACHRPQGVLEHGNLAEMGLDVDFNTGSENQNRSETVDDSSLCDLGFTSAGQSTLASSSPLMSVNQSVVSSLFDNFSHATNSIETSASSRRESSTDPLFGGDYFGVAINNSSGGLFSESQHASTVQTQTASDDLDLREFLTAGCQTTDFDSVTQMHTQTQTMDEVFDQLFTNMETQTTNNNENSFMSEFGFVDIETQTNVIFQQNNTGLESTSVETQFTPTDMETQTTINLGQSGSLYLSTAGTQTSLQRAAPPTLRSQQTETQTQTFLSNLNDFTPGLQDSHTQTTWNELESLVNNLS